MSGKKILFQVVPLVNVIIHVSFTIFLVVIILLGKIKKDTTAFSHGKFFFFFFKWGIPDGSERKNLPARRETWFRSLGREEGNGNPLQYFCLENSTDRGDWQAIVHEVTKSQT